MLGKLLGGSLSGQNMMNAFTGVTGQLGIILAGQSHRNES